MKKLFKKLALMVVALLTFSVGSNYTVKEVRAAGLTATYTVTSTSAVSTSGTIPDGSTATYKSTYTSKEQLTANKSMTLTLDGYDGYIVKGITLSMKSNTSKGAGSLSVKAGNTTIASISACNFNDKNWYGAWSTSYVDVNPALSNDSYVIASGESLTITIAATVNSLYCKSFSVTYEQASLSNKESIEMCKTSASLGFDYSLKFTNASQEAYSLVSNVSELTVGDQIVIAASGYNYAISTTQNTNNRTSAPVVKKDNIIEFDSSVQVITLGEGKISGTYSLGVGDNKYLYAASSSNNYLKSGYLDENASWSISIGANSVATIKSCGSYTRNLLRYNDQSNLFSCYSSGQKDVVIYKLSMTEVNTVSSASFDNISILFGATVESSLFDDFQDVSAGVMFSAGDVLDVSNAVEKEVETLVENDGVYSVGAVLEVFADGEVVTDGTKDRLSKNVTAAVYFVVDGETVILESKTYSVKTMVDYYIINADSLGIEDQYTIDALETLQAYISAE